MNFFAEQDKARRKTGLLVFLLVLAVVGLIAVTALALAVYMHFAQGMGNSADMANRVNQSAGDIISQAFLSDTLIWAAIGICSVVFFGSLYKLFAIGGSGARVAEALGGKIIPPNTGDPYERKVLNVVEEMAIASGNPVPQVYLLEEHGINAFAAGMDRRNAVIGVTRGCIEFLNRSELQGVIAHEFSHIHNGDMRLNLRLVAILHGILLIGLIGGYLLRSSSFSSRDSKGRGAMAGAGLALFVLGYAGVFFGSLIKAAVSRQREFLADASAVQFTRDPTGISGALKKIGGLYDHGELETPAAHEYSHFYFANGVKNFLGSITATHPPLPMRISRIDKSWDGRFIEPQKTEESTPPPEPEPEASAKDKFGTLASVAVLAEAINNIGNPSEQNLATAQDILQKLDDELHQASHEPASARAIIYALLLSPEAGTRKQQEALIASEAYPATADAFKQIKTKVAALPEEQTLPLVECAIPALKLQSQDQYAHFKKMLAQLIKVDNAVSLLEWCLYRIITTNCENKTERGKSSLKDNTRAIGMLISAVVFSGGNHDPEAAFNAAQRALPELKLIYEDGAEITYQALDKALRSLCDLKPLVKPAVLKAIAASIQADNKITHKEALMFRAIADTLNCPVPLLEID